MLLARKCSECEHESRATALSPLLSNPDLRVWTYCVTDIPTARATIECFENC